MDKLSILDLIKQTYDYQETILFYIENNIWIGWLSYFFMQHLIKELLYFRDKVNGFGYNIDSETSFWLWHHRSEVEANEKLPDPLEENLSDKVKDFIDQIKELEEDVKRIRKGTNIHRLNKTTQYILNEYLNQNMEIKDGILDKTLLSNISLNLINHVIREGERAKIIFRMLK